MKNKKLLGVGLLVILIAVFAIAYGAFHEKPVEGTKEITIEVNPDDIKPEAELVTDLGINSLELADLILLCEERYGIEIQDDDLHKFITVGDVAKYLEDVAK